MGSVEMRVYHRGIRTPVTPLPWEEALPAVLALARPKGVETTPLVHAPGRVLASDVRADRPFPPFPRAAMDGYAFRWTGEGGRGPFPVAATLAAGTLLSEEVPAGSCARVYTGAALPPFLDTVVPLEETEASGEGAVLLAAAVKRGQHVAARGEDALEGDLLVPAGTLIFPRHVALLAAAGVPLVPVFRRPSAAVAATGGELVEPGEEASGPFIRNSNGPMVLSALAASGFPDTTYLGILRDDREALREGLAEGLRRDLLVVTGGVSASDADLVPPALRDLGVRPVVHRVAIQPGKPLYAGVSPEGCVVLGLPGNPVAAMLHLGMVVLPFLRKASGARECLPRPIHLPLAADARNRGGRKKFVPARLETDGGITRVAEIPSHGSGDLVSASRADGVFEIPAGVASLPAGTTVPFHPCWGELLGGAP
jgi:molybdopterin molybdotransferase